MASELSETVAGLVMIVAIFGIAFTNSPIREDYLWSILLKVFLFGIAVFVVGVNYGMSRGQQ